MTKYEYRKIRESLEGAMRNLDKTYLQDCAPFKKGDRIKIYNIYGIIDSINLNRYGYFEGWYYKIKKDGTLYKIRNHIDDYMLQHATLVPSNDKINNSND